MNHKFENPVSHSLLTTLLVFASLTHLRASDIELLGSLKVSGKFQDKSGLREELAPGLPHHLFGAISALEHLHGTRYLALADRGPADGASAFKCRFHEIDLQLQNGQLEFQLIRTVLLTDEQGTALTGALEAFDTTHPELSKRFDPEGIRALDSEHFFISDEYGPFLAEFSNNGRRLRRVAVPGNFGILNPSADPQEEDSRNSTGRAANSGWEGLAISPDKRFLMAATQKSLLQDRVSSGNTKPPTPFTRWCQFDLSSSKTKQFAYLLADAKLGVSEILAVGPESYLSLERDSKAGADARVKNIYLVSNAHATDVSHEASLASGLPSHMAPLQKKLLIDLLDPRWGMNGTQAPEKWEGLAFGPSLPDGRRLLIVALDNDYEPHVPTIFLAFAIAPDLLPGFAW